MQKSVCSIPTLTRMHQSRLSESCLSLGTRHQKRYKATGVQARSERFGCRPTSDTGGGGATLAGRAPSLHAAHRAPSAPCGSSSQPSSLEAGHYVTSEFEVRAKRLHVAEYPIDSASMPALHVLLLVPIIAWEGVRVIRAEHAGRHDPQPLLEVHGYSPPLMKSNAPSIARMAPFPASSSARSSIAE